MTGRRGHKGREVATALLALFVSACAPPPAPPDEAAPAAGPLFTDETERAGVRFVTRCGNPVKRHLLETTCGGVALADYDGDGDVDLYLTTAQTTDDWLAGRRPAANALFRNEGSGRFVDVAEEAGVALRAFSQGAYFADVDNDGRRDLFVTAWGPNVLFRNEGNGRFRDVTEEAGVAGDGRDWSTGAAFADLDSDGDLDLYVANYVSYDLENPPGGGSTTIWRGVAVLRGPHGLEPQTDRLYRNDGNGRFTEIGREAGIDAVTRFGLGVVSGDFDDDGDADLYVANDSQANLLWRNDGGLTFTDVAALSGAATNEDAKNQAGMGADAADFDGDGRLDIVVTNFSHDWNTLYRNTGGLGFVDETFAAGMRESFLDLSWGVEFFDYDDDGRLDLFVANGHIYPEVDAHPDLKSTYRQRNRLYRNGGGRLEEVTDRAGPGLAVLESSRGAASGDLDGDGDLDLVVTNLDAAPNLLINSGSGAAWVAFELVGTASNRDAVGARLTLEAGGGRQVRQVGPCGSYLSQRPHAVHFGLGEASRIDRIEIRWPSGRVEEHRDLEARRVWRVVEGEAPS